MASFWYTKAIGKIFRVGSPTIDLDGDTFKCGLSTTVHVPSRDDAFLNDGGADDFVSGELNGTGYAGGYGAAGRKPLVNRAVADQLSGAGASANRVQITADPLTWTALYSVVVAQGTICKEVTVNTDSPVIFNLDFPDVNPGGSDFTVSFPSTGIAYAQC